MSGPPGGPQGGGEEGENGLHSVQSLPAKERAAQKPLGAAFMARSQTVPGSIASREFWGSLPVSTRLFLVWSVLDAVMVVYYSIWQFRDVCVGGVHRPGEELNEQCSGELLHILLGLLVTAAFFVVLVWDAVANENDLELLATILLSFLVTGRVLFHLFSQHKETELTRKSGIVLSIFFEVTTLCLAYISYRKFGWRVYSKVACDLRLKDAEEKRRQYFMLHRYKTLVKLDIMFLILMFVAGAVMALEKNKDEVKRTSLWNMGLLASICIATIVSTIWLVLAIRIVRKEENLAPCKKLEYTLPLNFLFPILAIAFVYGDTRERDARVAKESLVIAIIFFLITRMAVWWYMRSLMALAAKAPLPDSRRSERKDHIGSINPDLLPLLKGSWITKPTFNSPEKRRFFQLSQDYTTLRWAWNNYVFLYLVDSMDESDEALSITLQFAMEPELVLKFKTPSEYQAWKRGLTLVLSMLMSPDAGIHPTTPSQSDQHGEVCGRKNFADQPNAVLHKFLKGIGIAVHNRRAGGDAIPPALASKSHNDIAEQLAKQMSKHSAKWSSAARPSGLFTTHTNLAAVMDLPDDTDARKVTGNIHRGEDAHLVPSKLVQSDEDAASVSVTPRPDTGRPLPIVAAAASQVSEVRTPHPLVNDLGLQMNVEMVDYSDLEFGKFLGAGAEGQVWAGWYLETPVAVKKTDSMHEVEMLMSVGQHDNVVGLRGLCKKGTDTYIVLEYCPRGTLDVMVHQTMSARWELRKVLQIVKGIARGMFHLHTRRPPIMHRDLKPANIFISHGLVMKVGDFGMSRHASPVDEESSPTPSHSELTRQLTPGVIGTPTYTAPEVLDERLQTKDFKADLALKIDVYSYGVTLWEVMMRERAHGSLQFYEIVSRWVTQPEEMRLPPLPIPKDEMEYNKKVIRSLSELIAQCTSVDPVNRPDFKTILKRLNQLSKDLGKDMEMVTSQDSRLS